MYGSVVCSRKLRQAYILNDTVEQKIVVNRDSDLYTIGYRKEPWRYYFIFYLQTSFIKKTSTIHPLLASEQYILLYNHKSQFHLGY